jgi:hypothetical protein
MDRLLTKYADRFGENLPMFFLRSKTEEEIIEIVRKCLDEGKPFDVGDLDPASDY